MRPGGRCIENGSEVAVEPGERLPDDQGVRCVMTTVPVHQALVRLSPDLASTCHELPPVAVKGIRQPVKTFEVPWQTT